MHGGLACGVAVMLVGSRACCSQLTVFDAARGYIRFGITFYALPRAFTCDQTLKSPMVYSF